MAAASRQPTSSLLNSLHWRKSRIEAAGVMPRRFLIPAMRSRRVLSAAANQRGERCHENPIIDLNAPSARNPRRRKKPNDSRQKPINRRPESLNPARPSPKIRRNSRSGRRSASDVRCGPVSASCSAPSVDDCGIDQRVNCRKKLQAISAASASRHCGPISRRTTQRSGEVCFLDGMAWPAPTIV